MNYVMVDQQFGVDLIKQRWGLFKIVWLFDPTFAALAKYLGGTIAKILTVLFVGSEF